MAVQAQYPSNILLNRNGQEGGNDYRLQPHPGGFLHQPSQILLPTNHGGSSSCGKRGREEAVTASGGGMATIHQFASSMQPHSQQQLIDLSQLHTSNRHQSNVVSTGLRLSFGHHQQQQQSSNIFISTLSDEDFATQIKRQRCEMDNFLHAQGDELRRILAEKRQRHYRALLSAAEDLISRRLREKESEVEKATRRNAELEARAAQLSVEVQVWQAKARAQETMATSLQSELQHAILNGCGGVAAENRRSNDRLGCSGRGIEGQVEDAESAYVDPERMTVSGGPSCKGCRKKAATVVMLPCRHLCLCRECDQIVHACPLCSLARQSSVEVFLC